MRTAGRSRERRGFILSMQIPWYSHGRKNMSSLCHPAAPAGTAGPSCAVEQQEKSRQAEGSCSSAARRPFTLSLLKEQSLGSSRLWKCRNLYSSNAGCSSLHNYHCYLLLCRLKAAVRARKATAHVTSKTGKLAVLAENELGQLGNSLKFIDRRSGC